MFFLVIYLLVGVCFFVQSVSAKKMNPRTLISRSFINPPKQRFSPEAVEQYANKVAKMLKWVGIFYIVIAFVQYFVGSIEFALIALFVSIMFVCIYQFYCQKTLLGKASTGALIFVILVTVGIFTRMAYSYIEAQVIVDDENIRITGSYGAKIPLNQVNAVFLADTLPSIALRTNGISTGAIRKGYFSSKSLKRNVKLLLHSKTKPYIYIIYANNRYVIVNFRKQEKSMHVYEQLKGLPGSE